MDFHPEEILFLPSTWCNLKCAHCAPPQTKRILSVKDAVRFLLQGKEQHITKVGFTGGEVFLHTGFLYTLVRKAREADMVFSFITTNGVWFKDRKQLITVLSGLRRAGYDGSFFLSVDAFHRGSIQKAALFIEETARIWQRPDAVSLAYVWGVRQKETEERIQELSGLLKTKLHYSLARGTCCLRSPEYVVRTFKVPFSAARGKDWIRDPWRAAQWFQEDYCKGPGNVLFVLPDGTVKPCCGYGSHSNQLTLGNITVDSVRTILSRSKKNPCIRLIFHKGLTFIRAQLEKDGAHFPGKTLDHCAFCEYFLAHYPGVSSG